MTQDVPDENPDIGPPAGEQGATNDAGEAAKLREPDPDSKGLSELEAAQREANENRDRYLRLAAELDNVRKRSSRELENARRYGLERLAQALLPVRDSLEAGVAAAENADVESLLEGKRATLRLLDAALDQAGIEELDPEGEPFDPERHEAMTMQPSETEEPNTVLSVIQKGYSIHERLLRPARVIVAKEALPGNED